MTSQPRKLTAMVWLGPRCPTPTMTQRTPCISYRPRRLFGLNVWVGRELAATPTTVHSTQTMEVDS
jgi:hypothetical protein